MCEPTADQLNSGGEGATCGRDSGGGSSLEALRPGELASCDLHIDGALLHSPLTQNNDFDSNTHAGPSMLS